MAELEKCNAKTNIELNKAYTNGDDKERTKRFQAMCLIMSAESDRYSVIWNNLNNSTLLGTENYTKTTTSAYDVLCYYKKPAPPCQVHAPPAAVPFFQSGDTEKNKTTKVKMCTSGIDHKSNGYYSASMEMRTIFCLRQGRDEPMEVYYRHFEVAISTSKLAECNATTHI